MLTDTGETKTFEHGVARVHTAGSGKAWVYDDGIAKDRVRFQWDALDSWFEEDEEVFVHPRNPYARCDAIKSDPARPGRRSTAWCWPSPRRP